MPRIGLWLSGLVVLICSFLITNWILLKPRLLDVTGRLDWTFTDEKSLDTVANAAGFHASKDLTGHIDNMARLDARQIRMSGWALDISGDGSPLIVNVFSKAHNIATFRTDGSRPDIASAIEKGTIKATPASAKNTQILTNVPCAPKDKLFVVITTKAKAYSLLTQEPLVCP